MSAPTENAIEQRKPWQFKPGNPGKLPGTKNKATAKAKALLLEALEILDQPDRAKEKRNGDPYFVWLAEQHPQSFVAILRQYIPKELLVKVEDDRKLTYRNFSGSASRYSPQAPLEPDPEVLEAEFETSDD